MRHLLATLFLSLPLLAQVEAPAPLVAMNLAAHPDDEDGRTLAYYRFGRNAITYSVIFTRGEGGQNEIGSELYEYLGALRTEETERAARILGTQVWFLNYEDFGFSRFAHEAFDRWGGRDEVVSRLVYIFRKLKPDIVFTNHDTVTVGPRRQHGHHQAVGIAAYEAFERSADPNFRPEQLEEDGVDLWQPKRLFLRYWTRPAAYDVRIPAGETDPRTGASHAERAAVALAEHASQGMDFFARSRWRDPGSAATYFRLLRSAGDFPLDSLDLAGNLPPNTETKPDLPYLLDSGRLAEIPADSVRTATRFATPGRRMVLVWPRSILPKNTSLSFEFEAPDGSYVEKIEQTEAGVSVTLRIAQEPVFTWPKARHQYERFLNRPPIRYAIRDGTDGPLLTGGYLPLEIAPDIVLEDLPDVVLLRPGTNNLPIRGTVYNRVSRCEYLRVSVFASGRRDPVATATAIPGISSENTFAAALSLVLPEDARAGVYEVLIEARGAHIAQTEERRPARVLDVQVSPELRVGIVESYDGSLTEAARVLGIEPVLLDSIALASSDLSALHTILIDIRAYFVRRDLRIHNDRLLQWVADGGHLIVNYHKTFEWNAGYPDPFEADRRNPGNFAPFPLTLGSERVTLEDAPVRVLQPDHRLFRRPNVIVAEDWDGWVQERGLYFPQAYDSAYTELLGLSDPGEREHRGSTLLVRYGSGTYLYTALAWYRQLKRYHPGAFKVFANMISFPLSG